MAVVSAFTMVRMLALAHIMLAFLFLTAPEKAADQNLVYILGSSMKLVSPIFPADALCRCQEPCRRTRSSF